jgi:undecaprenyl diphosphate synthase
MQNNQTNIPNHVAIIMDGNGRWAKARGFERTKGHEIGSDVSEKIIKAAIKSGVKYLTIYAFSQENWERPQAEIGFLMGLLKNKLKSKLQEMHEAGIRIRMIGERTKLDAEIAAEMAKAEDLTANNDKLTLVIALSYGARQEILRAVEASGGNPEKFAAALDTHGIPDPDLLIRTGGEKRISNFLLWQIAYTELYFTDKAWPEFDEADFAAALQEFQQRERRYGK